mmetsp:Transcript_41208/g.110031  ORF Transcript_41208/g.110031 Transcript_41208/m.110031 type:complete len:218 (+) Transcript_41208:601-1254(+)
MSEKMDSSYTFGGTDYSSAVDVWDGSSWVQVTYSCSSLDAGPCWEPTSGQNVCCKIDNSNKWTECADATYGTEGQWTHGGGNCNQHLRCVEDDQAQDHVVLFVRPMCDVLPTPVPSPVPTAHPTARPSPSPVDLTNPDHSWDFRTCNSSSTTLSDTYGGLTATLVNGAQCTTDGIVFDGSDDYVDLEDWEWGGTVVRQVGRPAILVAFDRLWRWGQC